MQIRLTIDALVTLVWAALFSKLWLSNKLFLLIHPNYRLLTIGAGLVLVTLSVFVLLRPESAESEHHTLLPSKWSGLILLVSGVLGLVIPPRPFMSDIALQRGIEESFITVRGVQTFRRSNRPEQRSIVEWVRILNVYPEPDAYKGQKVDVEGFVMHPQDFSEEYILLARFVITCCAADVYPVGLLVKLNGNDRSQYPPDSWLRVKGEMTTIEWQGKRKLAILPQELTPIPTPKNPYDY